MDKGPLARFRAATEHQCRATGAAGDLFVGNKTRESSQHGFGDSERGRHIGIYRGGKPWIDHASRAKSSIDGSSETLIDGEKTIDQRNQTVRAGGAHQRRTNIRRPLGLIATAGKVEVKLVTGFLDRYVNPNGVRKVDAIMM